MMRQIYLKIKAQIPAGIMLLILVLVFGLNARTFFSGRNLINIVMQQAPMAILAIGLTFVVVSGGIDLSGGAVIALVGALCGRLLVRGLPPLLVFVIGIFTGAMAGLFNGLCVAELKMPSFILTLATSIMARGAAFAISGGTTLYGLPESFLFLGAGSFFAFPLSVLLVFILYLVFQLVLGHTVFGYYTYAVGEDPKGAGMAGIAERKVRICVFVLAGVLYALAAVVLTGQMGASTSTGGEGMEMTALACLAIGGVSLSGGRGNLLGTFLGCMIIGVLTNGVNMLNLSPYYTDFIRGLVIFGALLIECCRVMMSGGEKANEE